MTHLIEVKLRDVHQLFNSMDPSPFHDKDLDGDAEEFIVNWSQEFPLDEPLTLRVHLEQWPDEDPAPLIRDAVHNYFTYRAKISAMEFRRLMRQGRLSLTIGLVFLAVCLVTGTALAPRIPPVGAFVREGLTIAGWVAMWRPMQIYLYDWWPVRRHTRNLTRLSEMTVELVPRTTT